MQKNIHLIQEGNVKEILNREREFDFAQFLKILRKSLGVSRHFVASQTSLSVWRLYRWERGEFIKELHVGDLLGLSDYYTVPFKLLVKKMREYLMNRELDI